MGGGGRAGFTKICRAKIRWRQETGRAANAFACLVGLLGHGERTISRARVYIHFMSENKTSGLTRSLSPTPVQVAQQASASSGRCRMCHSRARQVCFLGDNRRRLPAEFEKNQGQMIGGSLGS